MPVAGHGWQHGAKKMPGERADSSLSANQRGSLGLEGDHACRCRRRRPFDLLGLREILPGQQGQASCVLGPDHWAFKLLGWLVGPKLGLGLRPNKIKTQ